MPLRSLIYLTDIIKPIVKDQDIFGRKRIMIPTPRFVVFYNGLEKRPAVEKLKLSDSFENYTEEPELELVCTVYNINPGCDNGILDKSRVLAEYTTFIEQVRLYQGLLYDEPVDKASQRIFAIRSATCS